MENIEPQPGIASPSQDSMTLFITADSAAYTAGIISNHEHHSSGSAYTPEITTDQSEAEESLWGSRLHADGGQRSATSVDGDEVACDVSADEPISAQEFVDLLRAKHLLPNLLSEEEAKEV
jgi:hypothetical protein